MPITSIPPASTLSDQQYLQVQGGDGVLTGYMYDAQQRALYAKESQVIYPEFHGLSHISEDPIPDATCDTPGLMSPDDKCKLDSIIRTRVGVAGFMGSGFPDDGGWLSGDIMLTTGTEFISIERVGNVIRFTVDSPIPLACSCEECTQIFWVQDETDIASIRPPACGGKLPGINGYGELKIYLYPESTIADPNNTEATLNNKGLHPALIFKRYDDGITPGNAEFELILQRDSNNAAQTQVGWAFTPGASGITECVWFTGKDTAGNQLRFELKPETNPNLMGSMLYKGHLITKKMGVVVDYTATILATNQYRVRQWDTNGQIAVGSTFTARNVWHYNNPLNPATGQNPKTLTLDTTADILPVGTLIDLWAFKVGETGGQPILRWFFSHRPHLNPRHLWSMVGGVQFGDSALAKEEVTPDAGSDDAVSSISVSAVRDFEHSLWGLTGFDDPLYSFDLAAAEGTDAYDISSQHRAVIDDTLPGLRVNADPVATGNYSERPVWLWNRTNLQNAILRADLGRPSSSSYSPIDIVIRGQIDEHEDRHMRVVDKGTINGLHYIRVAGVHLHDLPKFGTLRAIYPSERVNTLYNYHRKLAFASYMIGQGGTEGSAIATDDYSTSVVLVGGPTNSNYEYEGEVGDILELLHQEYSSPVVRLEFTMGDADLVQMQVKVGILDMSVAYENDDEDNDVDDYVRGLRAGYAVSAIYSQAGLFTGIGTKPTATPTNFTVYDGGAQSGGVEAEYWNRVEVMVRDNQVWVWWNGTLMPPSSTLSAQLDTPVTISTPYFTIPTDSTQPFGKCGLRLWPGATVRRIDVRTQLTSFNEYAYGQISIA
jgi:hypothetical protein